MPPSLYSLDAYSEGEKPIAVQKSDRSQDKGWFQYNESELELEEKEKQKPQGKSEQKEKPFTTEWFKENLPKYHSRAVDNPTDRNILAYEILQRIMIERSYHYARRTVEVMQKYPGLDGNTYSAGTNAGFSASRIEAEAETKRVFEKLKDRIGLWFFFDDSYLSKEQAKTMKVFKNMYPIEILPISIGGAQVSKEFFPDVEQDKGWAEKWGVTYFPAVFLVDAETKNFYPLSFNHVPVSVLVQKVLQVAKMEKLITDAEWEKAVTGGRINPFMEMVQHLEIGDTDIKDVDGLVDHFIEIGKLGHVKK